MELMHKEPFISLSSCVLQRSEPKVAGDGGELFGKGDNHEVHHKLVGQVSISLSVEAESFELF